MAPAQVSRVPIHSEGAHVGHAGARCRERKLSTSARVLMLANMAQSGLKRRAVSSGMNSTVPQPRRNPLTPGKGRLDQRRASRGENRVERLDMLPALPCRHRGEVAALKKPHHPFDEIKTQVRHVPGSHIRVLTGGAGQPCQYSTQRPGAFHDVLDDNEIAARI
jgi:hypothetical protein